MKFEKGTKPYNYVENIVTCDGCGKKFHKTLSLASKSKHHYCSRECRKTYVNHTCIVCGKTFETPKYRVNVKYCSRSCLAKDLLPQYSDHRFKCINGKSHAEPRKYKTIVVDGKRVREHRYLMEQHLGRKLTRNEHVHHIDGDYLNNELSNLEVLSNADHQRKEIELRKKISL